MGSLRLRITVLVVIVVVALGGAAAYLLSSRASQKAAINNASPVAQTSLGAVENGPRIVFRSTALGNSYGDVAMVSLNDPQGPRAFTKTSCDRVYATTSKMVCLASSPGVVTTYSAHVYGPAQQSIQSLPLAGIPSRARLSNDGTLASTTSFTSGDSYAGTSFSTRTVVSKIGGASYGDLEQFTLIHNGNSIDPSDRNYWGVTFAADDNTFYATVAFSGHTWLVRGDLATRTVTTIHEDAECPSLSPDGKTIVFKQRGDLPAGQWRLVRYDIATDKVTPLAETRSVDDQVAWLNDSTVLYGIPRGGSAGAVDDVWEVPADGTGTPKLLIPAAWSPAVVN
jgi:WD40-like Beta Propeller Repeat